MICAVLFCALYVNYRQHVMWNFEAQAVLAANCVPETMSMVSLTVPLFFVQKLLEPLMLQKFG